MNRWGGTSLRGGGIRGEKRPVNGRGRQGQDGGALWARGALSGKQLRGGGEEVSALGLLLPPPAGRERRQTGGTGRRRQRTERGGGGRREGRGRGDGEGEGKAWWWGGGYVLPPPRPLSFPTAKLGLGRHRDCLGEGGWGRCPPPSTPLFHPPSSQRASLILWGLWKKVQHLRFRHWVAISRLLLPRSLAEEVPSSGVRH